MANQPKVSVENNFVGGLKTEFTGLNFPENACTDTENCVFSLIGDVNRRLGIDYETNYAQNTVDRTGCAISTYKWNNAGGDGSTQFVVEQVGGTIYFYKSSAATIASPLSTKLLTATVTLSSFLVSGSTNDPKALECQYSDGNGYLFVYHPYCDPFSCSYDSASNTITANVINLQIRDFKGINEPSVDINFRPTTLSAEHNYNLQNQGWTAAPVWSATSNSAVGNIKAPADSYLPLGSVPFTVAAGIVGIVNGIAITIVGHIDCTLSNGMGYDLPVSATGTVTSYSGTTLTVNIISMVGYSVFPLFVSAQNGQTWYITPPAANNYIDAWHVAISNYPSNVDVWWAFKNSSDVFAPTSTIANVPNSTTPAPKGHFLINPFNWDPLTTSGITGITNVSTLRRPRTGAWFQGRVWYTGTDDSQAATGDQQYFSWTETIYFSQIITDATQFGLCYQINDPTDENLFNLLPTDGGTIQIQGCGAIYKLFPIQNGMLVFAGNGIWFITGSQGIGFAANDYTITKISGVRSFSGTSFVNVNGLPIFWNEEGIYTITPAQQGLGLNVEPITVGTILSFYNSIPHDSRKYARGDYDPLNYIIQWTYRSTQETDVTSRYQFDSLLNLNTYNKAFYPGRISGTPYINGIIYVSSPGGSNAPDPMFKYPCSVASSGTYKFTFADEHDLDYLDWQSYDTVGVDYSSFFVTGYKLHGQALRQWQPEYVYMYSNNEVPTSYKIQGIWNYATSGNSGKYSSVQLINNTQNYFGVVTRRHRIRGHGLSLQLKVSSVTGMPFSIIGWAIMENVNAGV